MRNPNYRTLFPSKDAEEPSFTFELLLLSIFGWPLMLLVCRVFRLPEEWNIIILLFYPIIFFIPIILIYLIIKNNYYKPVLLEISLIIFIIELSIGAINMGEPWGGNTPRPLVNIFLIINAVLLHILVWIAFFIQNKLILNICMAIMIGIALFDIQYIMIMSGFFHGYPFGMVEFWLELCIGSVKARHWNIHSTVKNIAIYTSIGMLITHLNILYKQTNKLIKSILS